MKKNCHLNFFFNDVVVTYLIRQSLDTNELKKIAWLFTYSYSKFLIVVNTYVLY